MTGFRRPNWLELADLVSHTTTYAGPKHLACFVRTYDPRTPSAGLGANATPVFRRPSSPGGAWVGLSCACFLLPQPKSISSCIIPFVTSACRQLLGFY
ncbi:hypothetical protein GQ53DRAFT_375934 [Thozetella sp. PMI_491]|nr:hypothetical protein GQ53DRAFT_375934 [Thozetella sp. PMI_491]